MSSCDERGVVTVFVVSMTVALLLVAGLVLDGGRVIAAHREADAVADAAARAGAQGLDEAGVRMHAGSPIEPGEASARVQRYLATTSFSGMATVAGDTVSVSVQSSQQLAILSLAGLSSTSVEGAGSATAIRAVGEAP